MIAKPAFSVSKKKCKLRADWDRGLLMDDEIERLKPGAMPADMQSWNIEDLQAYIDRMKAEISKVEALIAQKNKSTNLLHSLYHNREQFHFFLQMS